MRNVEMSDAEFAKRSNALIAAYADLIRKGLPAKETALWEARVEELPPIARKTVLGLVEMSDSLKTALAAQDRVRVR